MYVRSWEFRCTVTLGDSNYTPMSRPGTPENRSDGESYTTPRSSPIICPSVKRRRLNNRPRQVLRPHGQDQTGQNQGGANGGALVRPVAQRPGAGTRPAEQVAQPLAGGMFRPVRPDGRPPHAFATLRVEDRQDLPGWVQGLSGGLEDDRYLVFTPPSVQPSTQGNLPMTADEIQEDLRRLRERAPWRVNAIEAPRASGASPFPHGSRDLDVVIPLLTYIPPDMEVIPGPREPVEEVD